MSHVNTLATTLTSTFSTKLVGLSFAVFMTVAVNGGMLVAFNSDANTPDTALASAASVTLPTVTIVGHRV